MGSVSQRWPQARQKYIEYAANGPAVIALIRRKVGGLIAIDPVGSKVARLVTTAGHTEASEGGRAVAASEMISSGSYFLPHPAIPWCECGSLYLDQRHQEQIAREIERDDEAGAKHAIGAPWVWDYIDTFAAFPNVPHDEDVDVAAYGIMKLAPWVWREADSVQREAAEIGSAKPAETVQEQFREQIKRAMQPKAARQGINPWNRNR
jgi:hypothetical protein